MSVFVDTSKVIRYIAMLIKSKLTFCMNESFEQLNNDAEFTGVPKPTEEEAALEIQKRIEELRAFIREQ